MESQALIQVSESTRRALKTAFKKPLPNAARLQTRRAYLFSMVEDTKIKNLCVAAFCGSNIIENTGSGKFIVQCAQKY